jgi:hypothetical protein
MNAELQAQITQILSAITTSVGEVKDFSVSQLPDIAQQYINYGIVRSSVWVALNIIGIIICSIISFKIYKGWNKEDETIVFIIPFVAIAVSSIIFFCHNLHDLILVLTAPKVWFILQLKDLIS